jgi:hypothetical protein
MLAGDTTYVRGGTYSTEGNVRFSRSGTASAPIKLLNYPGESPVIDFLDQQVGDTVTFLHSSGQNVAMGYLTLDGFEIKNGYDGIKFYNIHNSVIRRNWIHDNINQGILGIGGHHNVFDRNIINHNGNFVGCANGELTSIGTTVCNQTHGLYMHGDSYTITNNIIYDNLAVGIQQNGSPTSSYTSSRHPGPEFSGASNWIIAENTIAYQSYGSGVLLWGSLSNNIRIENNILYENQQANGSSSAQGVFFTSMTGTGTTIRNNHCYASGSGGIGCIRTSGATEGVHYTQSGNVVNVSAPAFVDGGTNALPVSPDFRLTASAPVNIARTNEFLNNSTNVVGAFKTIASPTASIHANIVTLTFPMSTAVPIQIPSATGVSIGCTGANCPGSPAVSTATRKAGTDSQVDLVISGIASDACLDPATFPDQAWTTSNNSATGSWAGYDNIGPYPGLHQKIFSYTNLSVVNNCDGTGPGGGVGTPIITYKFDEGAGTTATNTGSSGATDDGTLANGAGWTTGKTGSALNLTGGTQIAQVTHGSGIDPTTQDMTWVLAINVPIGDTASLRYEFGPQNIGINQRLYVGRNDGTWRVSTQSTNLSSTTASNLSVTAGWQLLCLNVNASSDTVTLYKNDVAGTGGATRVITPFSLASDIQIGLAGGVFPAAVHPSAYDDFDFYNSVEDCAAIYATWNAPVASVGTFGMPATRFQSVYLTELGGSPTTFGTAINQAKDVVAGGAVAVLLEWQCQTGADCEQDAVRPEARHTDTLPFTGAESWLQIPDTENDTHIYMWGQDSNTLLNAGATTSRLSAGSCTVTNGVTLLTSAQVPVVDLPDGGCVVLRYIVRLGATASGYYDLRLSQQNGTAFTGTVTPARINVIGPQGSAF